VGISTTSEIVTKIMAERRAGQFLVDVMLGAPGATYNSFYRGKTLDPMPPALLLPEVTDLSKWWKGKHRYVDPEGQYDCALAARQLRLDGAAFHVPSSASGAKISRKILRRRDGSHLFQRFPT